MTASLRAFLFSFQTKLVLAMISVIVLAILIAGAVFVVRTRDERRESALERVAAASPAIYQQTFQAFLASQQDERPFDESLEELATEQDVRILILGPDSTILYDTRALLSGQELDVPISQFDDIQRGFVAWEPPEGFPERDVTLVAASSRFTFGPGREIPFRVVLAVESDTIADAWLGVLPSLGIAALVAVPLTALVGLALARQVAQPVRKLTAASEAMTRGDFDQRIALDRDDEIGRLARSFDVMAQHVGARRAQMHALLANVSHDLKTPMTSITGYAHSLSDGTAEPQDVARIAGVIREEAEHVNSLLADLLYLAEIDAGDIVTRSDDVALDALIGRCVRRIEPSASERGIDITLTTATDALVLPNADGEKLERALTNLLDNACKFSPRGGSVRVSCHPDQSDGQDGLIIEIANTGSAIPEEDLPRIFDRFFRGDRSRRTTGGSGLGLSIARELIELHRGTVAVANSEAGVTVTVRLPCGASQAAVATPLKIALET